MFHTINSSKHDSISISHLKSHQELVGQKRDLDYDIELVSRKQDIDNKTNYGGIFQGEKIDPKINNSDQLINSLIEESNRDNMKNQPDMSQFNKDLMEVNSPAPSRNNEAGSPSHSFLPFNNPSNNYKFQQQGNVNGGTSYQGISMIESNSNLNMMSQNRFGYGDITSKTALEEHDQFAPSNVQDGFAPFDPQQANFHHRQSMKKGTKSVNQQGISSPVAFNDIHTSPNAQALYHYQNSHTEDTNQPQNMQFALKNSRNLSFKNELSGGAAGSSRFFNKNQTSSSNAGHQSEGQNHQKSEFKKNSIATLHTRHRHKQNNIYVLAIFCLRVIKFAKNLFYYSQKQQFKLLNQMKIKIIGDSTSFFKYYYYSGQLKKDFLGLMIFILSYTSQEMLILSYLMIYRFFSVKKIFSDMENKFQLREKGLAYSQFIQLILSILMVAHYSASIFHYLAQVQYQDGVIDTWLKPQTNYHSPWTERYVISLYWSVITIITIGYGDITPKTLIERIYVILFTFIGCGLFAYSINVIGEQVREIGREKSIFKRKSAKLNKFMSLRGLNKDLQQKVRKYYEYLFNEQMNEDEEGTNVFNNLTTLLKKQVWIDVYGKLLKQKQIFQTNFSNDFINMLSLKVKEKKFGPEEYIFVNGDSSNYIFIIISGEVDQKGEMFGQLEYFSQTKRRSTIKTKCVTSVAYLHYSDFIETLSDFEVDREVYYQIKDQINLYKNYSNIDLKCPICSEYRHSTDQCNSVNFILYKDKLIQTAKSSENQIRRKERSSQRKYRFNSLKNWNDVKSKGFMIIVDILAEQIKETLSKEEDETILHNRIDSSEMIEANSQIDQEQDQDQKQVEISVSEDDGQDGSSVNKDERVERGRHFSLPIHKRYTKQLSQNMLSSQNRVKNSSLSEKQIHLEVSAEQEESQQNMTNIHRDSRKCKTLVSQAKSSNKSILLQQDSDRRIEICKSQHFIDYTYAIESDVNLYLIPYAYVIDEFFKFPQEVINSLCGQQPKSVQFSTSPTKQQHPISATSQYNKQISQKSENYSQVSSSNSISPTLFQQPMTQLSSLRHIEGQRNNYNINNLSNTNYSNTNSVNNQSPFPLSPSSTQFHGNYNFSNHPNINQNIIHTNTIYSMSPSNGNSQNNFNTLSSGNNNSNSFGTAVNVIQNQQDYNQMITANPFAAQYSQPTSPYSNRLGAYGIYLPALQQLEPINELQSKEILSSSSDENDDGEISSTKKSQLGNKVPVPAGVRRRSKEPSINLHMKSNPNKDSSTIQGNNSQYLGSNHTIGNHHMEAISPQRVQQHMSQESIQIQRGFSSEQESIPDDNYQAMMNARNRLPSQQHVQFAEDDNQAGNAFTNQNTMQSFEQAQQNSNSTGKNKKGKRNSHKPSKFSNNQYTYNSFVSQVSLLNQNQNKISTQASTDYSKNVFYSKNNSSYLQQYSQQPSLNNGNNQNQQQQNLNQGSITMLNNMNGNNSSVNNFATNFQQNLLFANNGFSSQLSWGYDPSSLYSKLMSRQSVQLQFKKDQDYCALIYKKRINLKGIDKVYEDIFNNFDAMKNYTYYFWHNNFSQISSKDKDRFIRRKFISTATTSKIRKASKTNETNNLRNTNRTSVQFHLSRANSYFVNQQTSLPSNKLSLTSINHAPLLTQKSKQLKTIQI